MNDRLGVSVVGMGYWGPNLIRNFFSSSKWNVVSVVDRDEGRLAKVRSQYPGVEVQREFEAALSDDRVHAVAIATPVETHFDLAKAALLSGKHVLVEKPMTETSSQGQELCAIARDRGLQLMVDHTFLYTGSVELLRKLIETGELGPILYIDSVRVNLGLFQNTVNVIYDLAPHDVSIFNYLLNEYPAEVAVQAATCIHDDMIDVAFLTLKYPSGVLAHAHLSWLSPVKQRLLTVAGRGKMALWNDSEPSEKVRIYDKGVEVNPDYESSARRMVSYRTGDMHAPALDAREALSKIVDDFYAAIVEGKRVRSTGDDGLAVVRVLEAAQQSLLARGASVEVLNGVPAC